MDGNKREENEWDAETYLEGVPQVDEEGMVQAGEEVELTHHVADGRLTRAHGLVHVLHSEHLLRVLLLHDAYLATNTKRVEV